MPKLTLLRGLPGAGKSTLAEKLVREGKADHWFEADQYFTSPLTGEYTFSREKLGEAHDWCLAQTAAKLGAGKNVVVSNTFTMLWELEKYLDVAKHFGAELEVLCLTTQFGSVHGVPPEAVERMAARWEAFPGEKQYP